MTDQETGTVLDTQPIDQPDPQTGKAKRQEKKKPLSSKVPIGKSAPPARELSVGDSVLLKVKHLHGYHATITNDLGEGQFVVRINEENHEGLLAQFSKDQLVPADGADLDEHQSTRLEWDYPEEE